MFDTRKRIIMNTGAARKLLLSSSIKNTLMSTGTAATLLAASSPAPVDVEINNVKVGGYIEGDFIYDLDQDLGDTLSASGIDTTPGLDETASVRAYAWHPICVTGAQACLDSAGSHK
jgi:hypothetical protein